MTASPVRNDTSRSLDKPPSKTPIFCACMTTPSINRTPRRPTVLPTVRAADPGGKFWAARARSRPMKKEDEAVEQADKAAEGGSRRKKRPTAKKPAGAAKKPSSKRSEEHTFELQ